jgi:uncharacterized protein YjdB
MSDRQWRIAVGSATAILMAVFLASCSGFFIGNNEIASISVTPTGAFLKPTGTQQFTATATFGNNTQGIVTDQVTWTSSQPAIASIDSAGLATGVALGNVTITARSTNNKTGSVTLTVSNRTVTSINISPTSATINSTFGQTTQQFTSTATFDDGTMTNQVNWSSSNTNVATVNSSGLASAVASGSCTITASLGGMSAPASLTVQ